MAKLCCNCGKKEVTSQGSRCKECQNDYMREYRRKHPEKFRRKHNRDINRTFPEPQDFKEETNFHGLWEGVNSSALKRAMLSGDFKKFMRLTKQEDTVCLKSH